MELSETCGLFITILSQFLTSCLISPEKSLLVFFFSASMFYRGRSRRISLLRMFADFTESRAERYSTTFQVEWRFILKRSE